MLYSSMVSPTDGKVCGASATEKSSNTCGSLIGWTVVWVMMISALARLDPASRDEGRPATGGRDDPTTKDIRHKPDAPDAMLAPSTQLGHPTNGLDHR